MKSQSCLSVSNALKYFNEMFQRHESQSTATVYSNVRTLQLSFRKQRYISFTISEKAFREISDTVFEGCLKQYPKDF